MVITFKVIIFIVKAKQTSKYRNLKSTDFEIDVKPVFNYSLKPCFCF